jgi:adenosylhomocysteine nucleosidase
LGQQVRQRLEEKLSGGTEQPAPSGEQDEQIGPDAAAPPQPCDIGVVFAFGIEAGGLVDRLVDPVSTRGAKLVEHAGSVDERRVAIVETGVGREAAGHGCRDLIETRHPDWIVSAGFAGALCPRLKRGHVLLADHVADAAGRSLAVELQLGEDAAGAWPSVHVGRLLTVDKLVTDPDEKRRLGETHDALACDMESLAVAEVCRDAKVRFLSVRIISDAVDEEIPPIIANYVKQKSLAGKLGAITGAVWKRPGNIKTMWKLHADATKLSERLAKFLCGVLPQLT